MGLTRPRFEQINSIITTISDPITVLNQGATLANIDVGFIINRNSGTLANTAIFWNESANTFVTAFTTASGGTNANISISTYANLRVSTLTATFVNTTGNIVSGGNVTAPYFFGNGSQLSGVITSVTKIINGTSDVTAYPDSNIAVTVGGTANTVVFTSSNIYVAGSILPTANIIYDLGSPTQRFRTGYFSANTIDIGGGTIGLHDVLGFTFITPGGEPQYMMPNGASTSNTFTSATVTIQGNLAVNGNITTIGNVSGQYILGSGQFLTGLPASYSNINVKAYTESMGFANYSNVNVAAYTTAQSYTNYSNVNVAAYTQTQSYTNYSNVNVIAYTQSMGFQNYGNVNVVAYLGSSAVTVGGNLTVLGNLIVQGTTTTINSTTLDISDLNITVAKGAASAAAANGAGLTVDGAGATLLYTSSTDSWNINKTFLSNSYINTTGNISAGGNASASYFTGSGQFLTGINSFGNIFIDGQSPVLADSISDTLTLVSGSGIAITTDAANDSIIFSSVSSSGPFATSGDFGAVNDPVTVSEDEGSVADGATITYDLGSIISASGLIYPDQLVLPSYATDSLPTAIVAAQLVYNTTANGLAFSDGTNWSNIGASYSNVQVATYLPTHAGTVSASLINSSGNVLSTGLSVFGNTRIGSLATPGAEHTIIGNVSVSGAGTEYFNIGGNILAIQGSFGSINSTGFINTSGNVSSGGNVTVANLIVSTGAGQFNGPFNESTTTAGVYVGNINLSPRIGFFNGNAAQNWQIDNNFGTFRWYTPGVVRMSLTDSGILSDGKGDVRSAPQNSQGGAYTLVVGDAGKHISITTGGVTVNASIFSVGDMVTIFNNSGSSQNITQGTSVTLRLAGTATTGTRALAQYGVATILCVTGGATPTFACSGAGLT